MERAAAAAAEANGGGGEGGGDTAYRPEPEAMARGERRPCSSTKGVYAYRKAAFALEPHTREPRQESRLSYTRAERATCTSHGSPVMPARRHV